MRAADTVVLSEWRELEQHRVRVKEGRTVWLYGDPDAAPGTIQLRINCDRAEPLASVPS